MKKQCCICKKLLDISSFYKNKTRPDGYMAECKECAKARARKYSRVKYGHKAVLPRLSSELKETHKQCPTCGQIKLRTMFYIAKRRQDGLSWQCKECENARKKTEILRRKHLTYSDLKGAKIYTRIENAEDSISNQGLNIAAHGVVIKDKNRKLPDNFVHEDLMDKPKKVFVTVRKSK